jgi:hypothetical protein
MRTRGRYRLLSLYDDAREKKEPYFQTDPIPSEEHRQTTYEFHWTSSDIINSFLGCGLVLHRIIETTASDSRFWQGVSYGKGSDDSLLDWHNNPRAGLPNWLTVITQKPVA